MGYLSVIRNEIKSIKINSDLEDLTLSDKHAFMYFCFEKLEDINPVEVLDICIEDFPKLNIGIDGFFINVDDSTVNLYNVLYSPDIEDGDYIDKKQFKAILDKGMNTVKMIIDKKINKIDKSSDTYDFLEQAVEKIKTHEIMLNIYTNYYVPEEIMPNDIVEYNGVNYGIKVVDYLALSLCREGDSDLYKLNLKEKFGYDFNVVKISSTDEFDIYMTAVTGDALAELYKIDSVRLLESNVRSYLKKTSRVNKGIYATVKDSPEEFAAYNNGLATVATDADAVKLNDAFYRIRSVTSWQIVNGGQTTATLFECMKDKLDLSEIIVPCKLTVLKNVDDPQTLISNISTFSNTQTAIKKSDPPSNLKYYIDIKRLSDSTWASNNNKNYLCFFERTNGEYNTAKRRNNYSASFNNKYPPKMKFTKLDLAKAIVCWEQRPDIANLGSEKNFEYFNNIVKDQPIEPDDTYYKKAYALILLYREIDKILKQRKTTTYKSNIVTYSIALISKFSQKQFDLISIWEEQEIPSRQKKDVENIIDLVVDKINNVPTGTDVRMWARTPKCWLEFQALKYKINEQSLSAQSIFFVKNEPKEWIEDPNNLKDSSTWIKLFDWNETHDVLKTKEKNMINSMRYNTECGKTISVAQKDWAVSIFLKAVKAGYDYKE